MKLKPIGYMALVERFGLEVLTPALSSYLLERGRRRTRVEEARCEEFYPPRDDPGSEWTDHLWFALKHEGVNLEVLAALFRNAPEQELTAWVAAAPISRYTRIAWFLYEWLTRRRLSLPDLTQGNYAPVLDPRRCHALPAERGAVRVRRQRVLNNLPGTPDYCPLVRRSAALELQIEARLDDQTRERLSRYPEAVIHRAAQYLYLKETRSSYALERIEPDQRRTARFVELLRQAGRMDCFTEAGLVSLQRQIVDERYAAAGFRDFQNYVGQNLGPGRELVHYVPPKPEDLPALMEGWMASCRRLLAGGVHPVVAATVAGFGFVFLHPFEDGNGRLHRLLIHHVLAAAGFTPEGVLFPVSALMLKQLPRYDAALESYSRPLLQQVEHCFAKEGKLRVRNETGCYYRFPDLTWLVEQVFGFIRDTIEVEFTAELEYLAAFDEARRLMQGVVDMPDRRLDLFIRLCLQGKGRLARGKRSQFRELSDKEISALEKVVAQAMRRRPLGQADAVGKKRP